MDDLSWTDELCADEVQALSRAAVLNGEVLLGSLAEVEPTDDSPLSGQPVTVEGLAAGFKGRGPFRKRLWVAAWVRSEAGESARVLASKLKVKTSSLA